MVRKYRYKNECIMKKIYIYMICCVLIGFLMVFRQSIRYLFIEDLNTPTTVDLSWKPNLGDIPYEHKILLELHHFNPRLASNYIAEKITELKTNKMGIHTLVLNGTPKIDTNTYIRELSKIDWGIEEIRVHSTAAINTYAFINLIKSSSALKRILIRNNHWDTETLAKIKSALKKETKLIIIKN